MKNVLFAIFFSFLCGTLEATPRLTGKQSITIFGRAESTITHDMMTISDIADVKSSKMDDDDAVIGIKKIIIKSAPQPGEEILLSGNEIVERLKGEGVNVDEVGYSFPRTMKVKRAGREVLQTEIVQAIDSYLKSQGREAEIKHVQFEPIVIAPHEPVMISVESETRSGANTAEYKVNLNGPEKKGSLSVRALLDEWVNMPVAKRSIAPGEVLQEDDVTFGKVSYASYPRSSTSSIKDIVGKKVDAGIKQGEPIKPASLSTPKLVSRNTKVLLLFKKGSVELQATGIALEDGSARQEVKVRNDASNKIVSGWVTEQGVVSVSFPEGGL